MGRGRAKRIKEKIDKERESRIRGKKKVAAKVNRKMAEKILEREEKNERRRAQRILAQGGDEKVEPTEAITVEAVEKEEGLLADSRFARLFQDEDYAVDETSREFLSLNPSTKAAPASNLDHEKGLTAVEEEAIDKVPRSDSDDSVEEPRYGKSSDKISSTDYKRKPQSKKSKKQMQMQVSSSRGTRSARDRSFASRAEASRPKERSRRSGGAVGEKIVTFEPQSGRKKSQAPANGPLGHSGYSSKERRSASGNTFRRM